MEIKEYLLSKREYEHMSFGEHRQTKASLCSAQVLSLAAMFRKFAVVDFLCAQDLAQECAQPHHPANGSARVRAVCTYKAFHLEHRSLT